MGLFNDVGFFLNMVEYNRQTFCFNIKYFLRFLLQFSIINNIFKTAYKNLNTLQKLVRLADNQKKKKSHAA